ncbi:oligosaccharide flippase family protein [Rhodobacter sp. Har01]|uniref:lipopolysaccharide biosynthesis protein n=1 Tax=Rhodobacter sp. Har01 TaxID=2883999 RepID=UPI001D05EE43|nr:oligosaccharide flippase family protein [Rhodobacter sp. Har01]MCB6179844.1 oligosaccharide flippase family protein [Rhodobacter sp. Har01]
MAEQDSFVVSKRLVVINSASSLLARIVNMTVLLWMYQYLLKRISPEEFAVLPVVSALMVFAPLFFSFFTGGISRYVVEAYAKGDRDRVTTIVSSIFPLLAAMAVVFLALGLLFAVNIEKVLNIAPGMVIPARVMMALLVVNFFIQMLVIPFATGFHVRQRYVELNLLGIARDVFRIMLQLVFLLGIGPQVVWVVVATVVAETIFSAVMVRRSLALVPELRLRSGAYDWGQARRLLNFGLWTTLGRLGAVMSTNAATILLNLYGSAVDVTSYYLGATFYRQINSTVALATQPLQPVLTAMHALEDRQRLRATVFRGGRYAMWVTLVVAVPLVIYANDFIALYLGGAYSQAGMVTILFMLILPFTQPTALLAMTAMAKEQVKVFFLPAFLFQLAGLVLMFASLTLTDTGAIGVALSLTVSVVGSQILYYWPLCLTMTDARMSDFRDQVLVPGVLPAAAGMVVWGGLRLLRAPDTWSSLIGFGAAGALVYAIVLFGFCLNPGERADLRKVFGRLLGRNSGT